MLVGVFLVSVVLFICFPVLNARRETARKTTCMNNLRQIAIATLNFESAHLKLPNGYNGPLTYIDTVTAFDTVPTGYRFGGPLPSSRPFIEIADSENYLRDYRVADAYWTSTHINTSVTSSRIEYYICPADNAASRRKLAGSADYSTFLLISGNGKGHWINDAGGHPRASCHQTTNYLGCAGDFIPSADQPAAWGRYRGVFEFGKQIKLEEITDGQSNTILYGEVTGRGTDSCFAWTASTQVVHWNTADFAGNPYPDYEGAWWCFGSSHPGDIINWVFVDGSTHAISEAIDPQTLKALAGREDGEPVNFY